MQSLWSKGMSDLRKAAEEALEILEKWDMLRFHEFQGNSEAMDALDEVAQLTPRVLINLYRVTREYDEFLLEIHEDFGVK
jgi:hypothetical protein